MSAILRWRCEVECANSGEYASALSVLQNVVQQSQHPASLIEDEPSLQIRLEYDDMVKEF